MINILEFICLFGIFLVGILIPFSMMVYMIIIFIKEQVEINKLIKRSK